MFYDGSIKSFIFPAILTGLCHVPLGKEGGGYGGLWGVGLLPLHICYLLS